MAPKSEAVGGGGGSCPWHGLLWQRQRSVAGEVLILDGRVGVVRRLVFGLLVVLECGVLGEAELTLAALVRLLSCVEAGVRLEVGLAGERLVAALHLTHERLLLGVGADVLVECGLLRVRLLTLIALERLLLSVDALVLQQSRQLSEAALADVAHVRLLSAVDEHVLVQCALLSEQLTALRTPVRSLTTVDLLVSLQSAQLTEALLTARMRTLERLLPAVDAQMDLEVGLGGEVILARLALVGRRLAVRLVLRQVSLQAALGGELGSAARHIAHDADVRDEDDGLLVNRGWSSSRTTRSSCGTRSGVDCGSGVGRRRYGEWRQQRSARWGHHVGGERQYCRLQLGLRLLLMV